MCLPSSCLSTEQGTVAKVLSRESLTSVNIFASGRAPNDLAQAAPGSSSTNLRIRGSRGPNIHPDYRPLTLYLFTTLQDPLKCSAQELAQLYGQRWKVELCFRYVKTQRDLGFLECHSADMAHKEWLAGLIAYNLIRWTMAAAAASA
jgi:hypothetical protein